MLGKESEQTLRRAKFLLWLLIQDGLGREREGVSRVDFHDVVNKKEANNPIQIDRLINIVMQYMSYQTDMPAMFRAVFSPVIVGFHSCESVDPL
jgi:hypothetical protein